MNTEKQYTCICGKTFKSKQALVGHYASCQKHKDDVKQKQLKALQEKEFKRLPNGMFKCENPNCGKEHDGSYGSGRFCCKSCYKSFVGYKSGKSRRLNKIERKATRAPYGTWKCERCNLIFETRVQLFTHNHEVHPVPKGQAWNKGLTKETDERVAKNSKHSLESFQKTIANGYINPTWKPEYWTLERREERKQNAIKRKIGGYHKHGGKGKRGWYKGFWCDSSWELAYVIYNLDHNIEFSRNKQGFEYIFEGTIKKYYPDFILNDGTYVEIKGWYDKKVFEKHRQFKENGNKLIVIDKETILPYLNYVINIYGKDFISLYEID